MKHTRDDKGRLLAEDGWPLGGNATVTEAARASGLSKGLIYRMVQSGELPSRRFGRAVRVSWSDIRRLLLVNTVASR